MQLTLMQNSDEESVYNEYSINIFLLTHYFFLTASSLSRSYLFVFLLLFSFCHFITNNDDKNIVFSYCVALVLIFVVLFVLETETC